MPSICVWTITPSSFAEIGSDPTRRARGFPAAGAERRSPLRNRGQYTRAYLKTKLAYRPTKEDLHGFTQPADDAGLIDHEVIPLSLALADAVITQLRAAATEIREAIDQARRA